MNYRQLYYAVELSEICNFSQVAEKLNITQPTLSKQILSLENELGVKLFDRVGRNLQLNAVGKLYLQYVSEALMVLDNGMTAVNDYKESVQQAVSAPISRQIFSAILSASAALYDIKSGRVITLLTRKLRAVYKGSPLNFSSFQYSCAS